MLIDITSVCRMNCRHCMNDCTPDGKHMDMDTFERSCKFIKKVKPKLLIIGGGEPTDHPDVINIVKRLKEICRNIVIASNGMFLRNDDLSGKLIELLDRTVIVQLTNDDRYYPIKIKNPRIKYVEYIDKILSMSSLGRAKENNIPKRSVVAPKCFNLRSIMSLSKDFISAIKSLEKLNKFCTPLIDQDGNIRAGESLKYCEIIGHVDDSIEELTNSLKSKKIGCDNCGMYSSLDPVEVMKKGKYISV